MFDWWINGILDLSVGQKVIATIILTQITIASVTLYLHRHSAHNALDLHPALKHFFRFWIWLSSAQNTKEWTAIHRKHHAKCETDEDPHSPVAKGLKTVLLTGAELYKEEAANAETLKRYGQRTPDDWLENKIYTPHKMKGVVLMGAIDIFFFGLAGITIWAIQMMWIPVFAAGVINGVGHAIGYRNFECKDASRNISPWGFFIGGEELHNNHHTYPNSAKLSVKPWEFDIGWFYIRILSALGLAKARNIPPKPIKDSHKLELDKDTVMAIIHNRFYVLSQYHKNVMIPVIQAQKAKMQEQEKIMFKKAKKLLVREENLVKSTEKSRINEMLDHDVMIKTIYEMSQALQDIWKKHPGSRFQEKLNELSEWCKQAEKSGIESLEEFAKSLRHYSLSAAKA
ncbi:MULTISPECIES: fatty acid desaturase [unclassified Oleiphilus]|jgi:fatty-acid desaturase|uniref:DesA family fatty acid desaturase n=3 Tax=Oleiphilus TaxID=141450 RepID=UPI0007C2FD66|nr:MULTISPECIES: fatty acid desaturase [unclassified Oleiphilus]KZY51530.1 aminotransferase [Oleiphilus sp. HI0050]KZY73894.1 aminotransferase [Oleiphilus sp. HI0068]KZY85341.1 aminotransferase [Oleiphilus sp. HI0069]KZY89131.1 aminotransferase [Oleiphilus sp. HI0072]KZZ09106.1 aminotransferase [Oleiphilus sp. HI0078]KZZ47367.1 aminotransferase [Oleiphilus sp. HI0085]